jgi:hypothetical protein
VQTETAFAILAGSLLLVLETSASHAEVCSLKFVTDVSPVEGIGWDLPHPDPLLAIEME